MRFLLGGKNLLTSSRGGARAIRAREGGCLRFHPERSHFNLEIEVALFQGGVRFKAE